MPSELDDEDFQQLVTEIRQAKKYGLLAAGTSATVLFAVGALESGLVEPFGVLFTLAIIFGGVLLALVTIAKAEAISGKNTRLVSLFRRLPSWEDPLSYDPERVADWVNRSK